MYCTVPKIKYYKKRITHQPPVADIFFGGLDELKEAITRMLANEEIAIVKLYDWLIPP